MPSRKLIVDRGDTAYADTPMERLRDDAHVALLHARESNTENGKQRS